MFQSLRGPTPVTLAQLDCGLFIDCYYASLLDVCLASFDKALFPGQVGTPRISCLDVCDPKVTDLMSYMSYSCTFLVPYTSPLRALTSSLQPVAASGPRRPRRAFAMARSDSCRQLCSCLLGAGVTSTFLFFRLVGPVLRLCRSSLSCAPPPRKGGAEDENGFQVGPEASLRVAEP